MSVATSLTPMNRPQNISDTQPLATDKWTLAISHMPTHTNPPAKRRCLLEGNLEEYGTYGNRDQQPHPSVDWLLHIVSLLFVGQVGRVVTHQTGSYIDWIDRFSSSEEWLPVLPGQQMQGNIYEFWLDDGTLAEPAKHCRRTRTSRTSNDPKIQDRSKAFRSHLAEREGNRCPITNTDSKFCIASHVIPKRLGRILPAVINTIRRDYEDPSQPEAPFIDVFDDRLGILVSKNVDTLLDKFELGFLTDRVRPSYLPALQIKLIINIP